MFPLEVVTGLLLVLLTVVFSLALYQMKVSMRKSKRIKKLEDKNTWLMNAGSPTRKVSDIEGAGLDIPEEDQAFLEPIIVEWLKWVVKTKQNTPTNAMLIDHLVDAIGAALKDFEPKKHNKYQRKNEGWLMVAAYATRLYMEGTPHDSSQMRDALIVNAHFADDNLKKWAKHMTDIIADQVRPMLSGDSQGVKDATQHVNKVLGTSYTADELDDMRKSFLNRDFKNKKN